MSQPGRNSKLTPALTQAIVEALRAGQTYRDAALAVGVSESTFHSWLAAGRENPDGKCAAFAAAIRQVETDRRHSSVVPLRPSPLAPVITTSFRRIEKKSMARGRDGKPILNAEGHPLFTTSIVETTTTTQKYDTAAAHRWLARHLSRDAQILPALRPKKPQLPSARPPAPNRTPTQ